MLFRPFTVKKGPYNKMKKKTLRALSAFLAMIMVVLMIPLQTTIVTAQSITSVEDMGKLGYGFNMLGDEYLSSTSVRLPIFKSVEGVNADYASDSYTTTNFTYISSMAAYIENESKKWNASVDINARMMLVALDIKAKFGMASTTSSSGSIDSEMAIIQVLARRGKYEMVIGDTQIKRLWNQDENNNFTTLDEDFVEALLNYSPEEFFALYGTHIITAYSAGGEAYASYQGSDLTSTSSSSNEWSVDATAQLSTRVVLDAKAGFDMVSSAGSSNTISGTVKQTSTKVTGGTGFSLENILSGGEEVINTWLSSLNKDTIQILNDDKLKLLPVWELLYQEEYQNRKTALEEYFNENVDSQYADFYSEYIYNPKGAADYSGYTFIQTAEELAAIADNLNGNYVLLNNIDLGGEEWAPIGTPEAPFTGILDGNGNTVSGLCVTKTTSGVAGLVGYNRGKVRNLTVKGEIDADATGSENDVAYIGGIVGYNAGEVMNCCNLVSVNGSIEIPNKVYVSNSPDDHPIDKIWFDTHKAEIENAIAEAEVKADAVIEVTDAPIKLVGDGNSHEIKIKDATSPAIIILENASFTGKIYNVDDNEREVCIISLGAENIIRGVTDAPAISLPNASLYIYGDADLSLYGGNGADGADGVAEGADGNPGADGKNAIVATDITVSIDAKLTLVGGNGGNGGKGSQGKQGVGGASGVIGATDGRTGGVGGKGGDGGEGGDGVSAIAQSTVLEILSGSVVVQNGTGGNGGEGGKGGKGGTGGYTNVITGVGGRGGTGGKGGTGGTPGVGYYQAPQGAVLFGGAQMIVINGKVGEAGQGGEGGDGGDGGFSEGWATGNSHGPGSPGEKGNPAMKPIAPENTENTNTLTQNAVFAGGVAGYNQGSVLLSKNEAHVSVYKAESVVGISAYAGGIAGYNGGKIEKAMSDGSVEAYAVTHSTAHYADAYASAIAFKAANAEMTSYKGSDALSAVAISPSGLANEKVSDAADIADGTEETPFEPIENEIETYWNNSKLTIESVGKTAYFVGDELDKASVRLSYGGEALSTYTVRYNFYSAGITVVTLLYDDGVTEYVRMLPVSVEVPVPVSLEMCDTPKMEFIKGEEFSTAGLSVRLNYNNGDSKKIPVGALVINEANTAVLGEQEVVVSYTLEDGVSTLSFSYTVTVSSLEANIVGVELLNEPYKTTYIEGEAINADGLILSVLWSDGRRTSVTDADEELSFVYDFTYAGEKTVLVKYRNFSDSFSCRVCTEEEYLEQITGVKVGSVSGCVGKTVKVNISLQNNVGILAAALSVHYDDTALTLVSAEAGEALSTLSYTAPGMFASPSTFAWDGVAEADATNGTLLTLTFEISEEATVGKTYEISVSYENGNIFGEDFENVELAVMDGGITVRDYTPGDLSGDGNVNMADVVSLRRHIVGGYTQSINLSAADVNGDGNVNMADVVSLRRYVVGGYGVVLH